MSLIKKIFGPGGSKKLDDYVKEIIKVEEKRESN